MNESKPQWKPAGLERFSHLEDKIFRLVEEFKGIRMENESLRAESQRMKEQIDALNRNESSARESLTRLQEEREELRERVEKALDLLATLDVR